MKNKWVRLLGVLCLAGVLVLLDQLTKGWAVKTLKPLQDTGIPLIKGVFELRYLENFGMAFGLLQNQQVFFYIITGILLVLMVLIILKTPGKKRFLPIFILLSLIMAGAVGNLIDRAAHKYVVDFLYFSLIDFPIFNVADCYVTVGVILLAGFLLFFYKDEEISEAYFPKKSKGKGSIS